ncbi:MAG: radical SAM/SPASM domain-containing protein, partial [Candidatus Binatia bacterium]
MSALARARRWVGQRAGAAWRELRALVELPDDIDGYRLTWKRLANVYRNRYELRRGRTVLRSRPTRLVIEPTNACNLRCPHCHTGAGRFGRPPAMLPPAPYLKLLDELGDYLLLIEVFNWGEPMLHPQLPALIAAASARGIATRVNTNLSIPFTAADAERLVASGLTDLFVSIDGATQAVYQRYRVGGDLALVTRNCRLIADAKRRLAKATPRLTLQFLQFPCNLDEGDAVRRLADELGMRLFALRGGVPEPGWGERAGWPPWFLSHVPAPCPFLWGQPVLTVDGQLAPCRGVFQSFDDFADLAASGSFQQAWNGAPYRTARGLF